MGNHEVLMLMMKPTVMSNSPFFISAWHGSQFGADVLVAFRKYFGDFWSCGWRNFAAATGVERPGIICFGCPLLEGKARFAWA